MDVECNIFDQTFLRPPAGGDREEDKARERFGKRETERMERRNGRVKQRTGKEIEGRRTAWRPGRAPGQGMCHRCAPTTRAENVLSGQERPSLTHTYIHAQVPPALI